MKYFVLILTFLFSTTYLYAEQAYLNCTVKMPPTGWTKDKVPNKAFKFVYWSPKEDLMVTLRITRKKSDLNDKDFLETIYNEFTSKGSPPARQKFNGNDYIIATQNRTESNIDMTVTQKFTMHKNFLYALVVTGVGVDPSKNDYVKKFLNSLKFKQVWEVQRHEDCSINVPNSLIKLVDENPIIKTSLISVDFKTTVSLLIAKNKTPFKEGYLDRWKKISLSNKIDVKILKYKKFKANGLEGFELIFKYNLKSNIVERVHKVIIKNNRLYQLQAACNGYSPLENDDIKKMFETFQVENKTSQ